MSLAQADAAAEAAGTGAPRVTLASIEAKIASVAYHHHETLTLAIVTMKNGFHVVGKSACASPANYNMEFGQRLAHQDAINQLWALEGYVLREKLRPSD